MVDHRSNMGKGPKDSSDSLNNGTDKKTSKNESSIKKGGFWRHACCIQSPSVVENPLDEQHPSTSEISRPGDKMERKGKENEQRLKDNFNSLLRQIAPDTLPASLRKSQEQLQEKDKQLQFRKESIPNITESFVNVLDTKRLLEGQLNETTQKNTELTETIHNLQTEKQTLLAKQQELLKIIRKDNQEKRDKDITNQRLEDKLKAEQEQKQTVEAKNQSLKDENQMLHKTVDNLARKFVDRGSIYEPKHGITQQHMLDSLVLEASGWNLRAPMIRRETQSSSEQNSEQPYQPKHDLTKLHTKIQKSLQETGRLPEIKRTLSKLQDSATSAANREASNAEKAGTSKASEPGDQDEAKGTTA